MQSIWLYARQNLIVRTGVLLAVLLSTPVTASFVDTGGALSTARSPASTGLPACLPMGPAEQKQRLLTALRDGGGALSPVDATHYRQAFAAAQQKNWRVVEQETAATADKRLVGTLWEQHLLSAEYKPGYAELAGWLQQYGDLSEADEVYRLAQHRKPAGGVALVHPAAPRGTIGFDAPAYSLPGIATLAHLKLEGTYKGDDNRRVNRLVTRVLAHLRDDAAPTAQHLLAESEATALLSPADRAALEARVAAGLLFDGEDEAALNLAEASLDHAATGETSWIAGLAAYRLHHYEAAKSHFIDMHQAAADVPWSASAGAFWAGRAAFAAGEKPEAERWYKLAAENRATFYGMLARRALGRETGLIMQAPTVSAKQVSRVNELSAGARALALLQIGETDLAEAELQRIEARDDPQLKEALLVLAETAHLPHLSQRLGFGVTGGTGREYDLGPYPIPHWRPKNGFNVDPALLYAIMRQESRFDPQAESMAGAVGLMQLMPDTAGALTRISDVDAALRDPETNLELGQRYVQSLLNDTEIANNLIMMAVAYNGGPGNLARWRKSARAETDPLLFLETVPAGETRGFIEQVMTNYWIYRLRLGQNTDSLTDLAAGRWPLYQALPARQTVVASLP